MKFRYSKIVTPLYVINTVIQAIISLLSPIAIMFFIAFLIEKYTSVGNWIYVVLILFGVFSGLYSMITFILKSEQAMKALEKQNSEKDGGSKENK